MDMLWIAALLMSVLLFLLGTGLWVALSLFTVALFAMIVFTDAPAGTIMASTTWSASASWTLTALPLFIWMGEILYRTRLSQDMFTGLSPWLQRVPGRLLHSNVIGCGIFAAVSGSSAATAATIGRISLPELRQRGYEERMAIGSLAGAGTLGLLIPPSIIMIVYGVAAEVSIARLFIAGILPGVILMLLFSGYIVLWSLANRSKVPADGERLSLAEKLWRGRLLIPVVLLIAAVIGSIYAGIATATEAAAVGVLGSLVLAAVSGSLTPATFLDSLMGATRTSCMIAFILAGASFLTIAMGFTGIPAALAEWISAMRLSPLALLAVLTAFFILLGCFLDGISMVVLTTSIVLPAVKAAGIDLLWFGIFIVLVVEMAQITPPVGFNLFVIQGLTGRNILYISRAALPFFGVLMLMTILVVMVPGIVTALPQQMLGR
ncbi:TRAP transporter large permease subunit [Azospirillum sp. RWY-5-1]|uniref:TRAP transporter large permease protein n=1 Tax=Azospirillum oleiclasticum TaxID=2735135 RepID=A0ABX2TCT5_9PROT|nr:TRAP transporter large permease subunit [Azospirillum oleiclasticum]NYZ13809.1 TRAP transporter large permease subunit [Azospirillum oleiclasticum]NYZ21081.1 TRAP transporter large permease subunit [Azospirillum oleiclasticum]